jgi:hypothetical protein
MTTIRAELTRAVMMTMMTTTRVEPTRAATMMTMTTTRAGVMITPAAMLTRTGFVAPRITVLTHTIQARRTWITTESVMPATTALIISTLVRQMRIRTASVIFVTIAPPRQTPVRMI